MVIDSISYCDKYTSLHKDFEKVFSFLQQLNENATGTTVLEEGNVWANVIEVKDGLRSAKVFEAHRTFIDIHYILTGEEKFGYANVDRLQTKQSYNMEDDYELLEGEINAISLRGGDFVITFPGDAHIPDFEKINDDKLIRVVVKVRI